MSENNFEHIRHSAAHMLAAAVQKLYPEVKLGIGPAIENGFYYDFEFPEGVTISDQDLSKIQKQMKKIISGGHEFERKEVSADEAREFEKAQPYKLELIDEFASEGQNLTLYTSGPFTDLCRGGHAEKTTEIPVDGLKLEKVAGAYWKGDESRQMLTRIYGLLFPSREELDAHLNMLEEAKKRDHRKLGKQLDLFTFSDLVGPGLPLFTPRGTIVREELSQFIAQLREERGFERVWIPHMAKSTLYETSGHWDKFEDDLFHVSSKKTDSKFVLKPMNCPHHTQIFDSVPRSYKDMPQRYYETTTVYRDENTGQIQGLTRVRCITQDDSHVFARRDQIEQEAQLAQEIITQLYATFGMELRLRLSVRDPENPDAYLGDDALWEDAENSLKAVIENNGLEYFVGEGEAAFYGPKIDYIAVDAIGREWQLATIQLDFNQPNRFGLSYTAESGAAEEPVMIHVATLGSIERFMGVIIEHFEGAFPLWLSPVQVQLIPVGEKHHEYVHGLAKEFENAGMRVHVDDADETVGNKIRKATKAKVPYMLVIGDKEMDSTDLMVRKRGEQDAVAIQKQAFLDQLHTQIQSRTTELS